MRSRTRFSRVFIGLLQLLFALPEIVLDLDALHGDGDLIGHDPHQFHLFGGEARAGFRAEGQCPDETVLGLQRVAAVGLYAVGFYQFGPDIGRVEDVFGDDPALSLATQPQTATP